jgi:hypothetical protein
VLTAEKSLRSEWGKNLPERELTQRWEWWEEEVHNSHAAAGLVARRARPPEDGCEKRGLLSQPCWR